MSIQTSSEELEQVRALAREFAAAELRPHVEQWDGARALDPGVLGHLAELGFFGMLVPEAYGGMEFDLPTYAAVLEELAWGEPSVALTVSIHSAFAVHLLLRHGTEAQKERWLGSLARGEALGCFALSEPDAGSDAAAVSTRAVRDGDGWILEGTKKWITNARLAGLAVVVARTDEGLAMFLVPTDTPGYEVGEREETMGMRPVEVLTVRLREARVGADALLGDPARGFTYAMQGLDLGRLGIAAQSVGIARAALEHARDYADQREQFGTKLRQFEAIQFKLADMATRVEAARALVRRAAAEPSTAASSMAKLFASETAMWVSTQAVQVFGGYGYMRDYPVEKLMRDAKATEIYEGTNEIQRVVIARELYRGEG
ncbi:MAG TPA: acyl-CoA dehydrogenase family protein [Longimicrobiales bacterium]